ncbi:MAG: [FeFe] hydrogenase H-cluster maturation GTPase HydF [Candidatus Omnitrophota bacterium]
MDMQKAPKSSRLHIGIFGRTNTGKSSFLNLLSGQDVSITSSVPGTTTDVVEKTMELLPVGPVVFLDTAGLDDVSVLSNERIRKTRKMFDRSDVIMLVTEPGLWSRYEDSVVKEAAARETPVIAVINKTDLSRPSGEFIDEVKKKTGRVMLCSSVGAGRRDEYVNLLKRYLVETSPGSFLNPPSLAENLVAPGGTVLLIVPIDMEAPKGRLILPQVQTIRDVLDKNAAAIIVKEDGYAGMLNEMKKPPDLIVCDSQVAMRIVKETPPGVKCTTFSILFAQNRGVLVDSVEAAVCIDDLKSGDKVLIAEACSHHPVEDDIGRMKIPRWLEEYTGAKLNIDTCAGRDYPEDLKEYKIVIHCGGCMITPREVFMRTQKAREHGVPVTNYGVCISFLHGVLERTIEPFPDALNAYKVGADPCVRPNMAQRAK